MLHFGKFVNRKLKIRVVSAASCKAILIKNISIKTMRLADVLASGWGMCRVVNGEKGIRFRISDLCILNSNVSL